MVRSSGQLTPEEVRCPICALRVRLSLAIMTKIDPASKCQHKQGWTVCPNLRLALGEARSSRSSTSRAPSSGQYRGGPHRA
jgi:hypothetical protein